MANILQNLHSINAYPIPTPALVSIAEGRGLDAEAEVTADIRKGKAYNLCKADVLMWLSMAPNVTQGGQTYSFSEDQREDMKAQALALLNEFETTKPKTRFGYKGSRL